MYVVVREPNRVAVSVALDGALRVGRDPDDELVLADRQASRHHACFVLDDGRATLQDVGSRHGTFVNGAWPGDARQLANEVPAPSLAERFARLDVDERALVEEALARAGGNASEAARLLGISRTMLRRRRERFSNPAEDP